MLSMRNPWSMNLGGGRSLKTEEDGNGGFHAMFEVFHQMHFLVSSSFMM